MSLNLHHIVRGAINAVNEDEPCYLIQSTGITTDEDFNRVSAYQAVFVLAQVQTLSGDDMQILNDNLKTEIDRKFYLYSDTPLNLYPKAQDRTEGRTGDFLYRVKAGTWWEIYNVAEDFNAAGWCQVLASLSVEPPDAVKACVPVPLGGEP